jgi:LPS O-antigen subunit length determinant protein (WzzB/FepE family)
MLITHLFAAASMFGSQFAKETWLSAVSITTIVAMALQVMNIISVCDYLFVVF